MREPGRGAGLEELERVYRMQFVRLLRTAALIVGDVEAARDVVQDAFALAVRSRSRFERRGSLEGWVWRIVVNAARQERRARGSVVALGRAPEVAAAANGAGVHDARVRALVAALPERQRLAVFLRYYADLEYETIADALEVRPGTVAATLHAAHRRLREALAEGVTE